MAESEIESRTPAGHSEGCEGLSRAGISRMFIRRLHRLTWDDYIITINHPTGSLARLLLLSWMAFVKGSMIMWTAVTHWFAASQKPRDSVPISGPTCNSTRELPGILVLMYGLLKDQLLRISIPRVEVALHCIAQLVLLGRKHFFHVAGILTTAASVSVLI